VISWFQAFAFKCCNVCRYVQVFDGVLGTCNGVLRACGRQSLLARVNLGGLWGVGVLTGFLFTFVAGVGVVGLWWGGAS
jgi:MATE family multidrug resistance protein